MNRQNTKKRRRVRRKNGIIRPASPYWSNLPLYWTKRIINPHISHIQDYLQLDNDVIQRKTVDKEQETIRILNHLLQPERRGSHLHILDYASKKYTQEAMELRDEFKLPGASFIDEYDDRCCRWVLLSNRKLPCGVKIEFPERDAPTLRKLTQDEVLNMEEGEKYECALLPKEYKNALIHIGHVIAASRNPEAYYQWSSHVIESLNQNELSDYEGLHWICHKIQTGADSDERNPTSNSLGAARMNLFRGFEGISGKTMRVNAYCINPMHIHIPGTPDPSITIDNEQINYYSNNNNNNNNYNKRKKQKRNHHQHDDDDDDEESEDEDEQKEKQYVYTEEDLESDLSNTHSATNWILKYSKPKSNYEIPKHPIFVEMFEKLNSKLMIDLQNSLAIELLRGAHSEKIDTNTSRRFFPERIIRALEASLDSKGNLHYNKKNMDIFRYLWQFLLSISAIDPKTRCRIVPRYEVFLPYCVKHNYATKSLVPVKYWNSSVLRWQETCKANHRDYIGPATLPKQYFPPSESKTVFGRKRVGVAHIALLYHYTEEYLTQACTIHSLDPSLRQYVQYDHTCQKNSIRARTCINPDHIKLRPLEEVVHDAMKKKNQKQQQESVDGENEDSKEEEASYNEEDSNSENQENSKEEEDEEETKEQTESFDMEHYMRQKLAATFSSAIKDGSIEFHSRK